MRYDSLNIILYILIIAIPIIAQIKISLSYSKYKKVDNKKGMSGFEVARKILDANGLEDIYVVETPGKKNFH